MAERTRVSVGGTEASRGDPDSRRWSLAAVKRMVGRASDAGEALAWKSALDDSRWRKVVGSSLQRRPLSWGPDSSRARVDSPGDRGQRPDRAERYDARDRDR